MNEFINAIKAPFTTISAEQQPRPAVMAITWAVIGLIGSKVLQ